MELSFSETISLKYQGVFFEGHAKFIDRVIYHTSDKLGKASIDLPEEDIFIEAEDRPPVLFFTIKIQNGSSIDFMLRGNNRIESFNKLKNYYDQLNSDLENSKKNRKGDFYTVYNSLPHNESFDLAYNFIDILPKNEFYLLNNYYYLGYETFVSGTYDCEFISSVSSELRAHYIEKLEENQTYKDNLVVLISEVKKFSDVVAKRFCIPEDFQVPIAWLLIKKAAVKYFAVKWSDEYGNIIQFTDFNKPLDDLLTAYTSCDLLDHNSAFVAHKFLNYLIYNKNDLEMNYGNIVNDIDAKISNLMDNKAFIAYENRLLREKDKDNRQVISIDEVDLMTGVEFERFVAKIFTKIGYSIELTKATGDQGIDVIAEKNGVKIGIQAKCYSSSVSNSAVQEATAGRNHYGLDKVIVVTNNYFTQSAIELAASNNVVLWDRNMLKEKLS